MSEGQMAASIEHALDALGVPEQVEAAGEFMPRGHTGGMFAGGFVGDGVGGGLPGFGDSIAVVGGALAGARVHDAAAGLPSYMIVGVTPAHVCGFASERRRREVGALVFRVPRSSIDVRVHQRVNVRVVELIETGSGARIELEGARLPVTHSKDVIVALGR